MNLKDNLKRIRKENNLSQEQLADKLNVSRQSVSKWESGQAYPEMDKVLQICKMFNLNIDELLNQDIKKVREEKNSKTDINKYVDSFLGFISKTYDMLNSMTKTQVIRCIFEQLFFILVFYCLSMIVAGVVERFFSGIVIVFKYNHILITLFDLIVIFIKAALFILNIILVIYLFKIRYLDYYEKTLDEPIIIKEENNEKEEKPKPDKIEKVIIRDPNHSEYRFISGILKIVTLFIKCFSILILLLSVFVLLSLLIFFVFSFMFVKTGLVFIGGVMILLSAIVIQIIIISTFYNFIVDRKYNIKFIERVLLTSLVSLGLGIGLFIIGFKDFEVKAEYGVKTEEIIEMQDNMLFQNSYEDEFIEEDRKDVRIVIEHAGTGKIELHQYGNDKFNIMSVYLIDDGESYLKTIRQIIKDINNKKLIDYGNIKIKIYASKENIEKFRENYNQLDELMRPKEEIE